MKHKSILFHCHVAPEGIYQKAYISGRTGYQFFDYESGTVNALAKDLESLGMDIAVALAPFEVLETVPSERWLRSRVDPGVDANKWLYNELKKQENILGFATISSKLRDVEAAIRTIEKYVGRDKIVGIKIASYDEYNYGIKYDDSSLHSLYERVQELEVPILFHTSSSPYNTPMLVEKVAENFPGIPLIMAHAGGSLYRQAARIVKNHANCYLDLTAVFRKDLGKLIPMEDLVRIIELLGSERFIYGADWPWAHEYPYSPVESIRKDLKIIANLPISEEAKSNIAGGTLEKLIQQDV